MSLLMKMKTMRPFSSTKSENKRVQQVLPGGGCGGVGEGGSGPNNVYTCKYI
jgi:hypothetical protein